MKIFGRTCCFLIYTIFVLIVGMGLYKYRDEVLSFLDIKYTQAVEYIKETTHKVTNNTNLPKLG
jgi:hypothetical protein